MRIGICIAMTWEMLANSHNASIFQATRVGYHFTRNLLRITTKRANINNGITGIIIDIGNRRKINMHTYLTKLPCYFPPILINQCIILYTSQYSVTRKFGHSFQSHAQSPLSIKSYQQRNIGPLLRQISKLYLLIQFTF